jgi:hypothetical protein
MKPIKAWAIVDGDKLDAWDGRLPMFWFRDVAEAELRCNGIEGATLVRVEVREVPRKAKR